MASVQERLQLKRVPLDKWSINEQLYLASAVVCSGDQNWMSVSRSLKMWCGGNRPCDWFSQKSCAAQYGKLLENVETPKRKKRNDKDTSQASVETASELILRKLTQERIAELQKCIQEEREEYAKTKEEIQAIQNGMLDESQLREMWSQIEAEEIQREKEQQKHAQWLKEREERKKELERAWRPNAHIYQVSPSQSPTKIQSHLKTKIEEMDVDDPNSRQGTSPLLTSLLKSPSQAPNPVSSMHHVTPVSQARVTAPTITNLLTGSGTNLICSTAQSPSNTMTFSPPLHSKPLTGPVHLDQSNSSVPQSPSQSAPTLSMLLENKNKESAQKVAQPSTSNRSEKSTGDQEIGAVDSPIKDEDQQLMEVFNGLIPDNIDELADILTENNAIILNPELLEEGSILDNVDELISADPNENANERSTVDQTLQAETSTKAEGKNFPATSGAETATDAMEIDSDAGETKLTHSACEHEKSDDKSELKQDESSSHSTEAEIEKMTVPTTIDDDSSDLSNDTPLSELIKQDTNAKLLEQQKANAAEKSETEILSQDIDSDSNDEKSLESLKREIQNMKEISNQAAAAEKAEEKSATEETKEEIVTEQETKNEEAVEAFEDKCEAMEEAKEEEKFQFEEEEEEKTEPKEELKAEESDDCEEIKDNEPETSQNAEKIEEKDSETVKEELKEEANEEKVEEVGDVVDDDDSNDGETCKIVETKTESKNEVKIEESKPIEHDLEQVVDDDVEEEKPAENKEKSEVVDAVVEMEENELEAGKTEAVESTEATEKPDEEDKTVIICDDIIEEIEDDDDDHLLAGVEESKDANDSKEGDLSKSEEKNSIESDDVVEIRDEDDKIDPSVIVIEENDDILSEDNHGVSTEKADYADEEPLIETRTRSLRMAEQERKISTDDELYEDAKENIEDIKTDDVETGADAESASQTIMIIDTDDDSPFEVKTGRTKRDYSRRKQESTQSIDKRSEETTSSDDVGSSISSRLRLKDRERSESPYIEEDSGEPAAKSKRRYSSTPNIDSLPNSPASSDDREYRGWKKSILLVYGGLVAHRCASLFAKPINNDQTPNYKSIVLQPMDLQTLKRNIESGAIRTTIEFRRTVMLMCYNAMFYNFDDDVTCTRAKEMLADALTLIDDIMDTWKKENEKAMSASTSSSGTTKNMRGRKSNRLMN